MKPTYPLLHVEEILPILKKFAVFGGLNDTQLYEVFKLLKVANYDEGELIYQRGEAPSHIYIVKQGEVKIILGTANISLELLSFGVGDCFGEDSVIGIQTHSSSALAVAPTELIVLERQALLNIYETDKELFGLLILNIARETARKLHKENEALAQYMLERSNPT